MELLRSLILVSEKAANVARKCRQNEHLFELLIEEKKENEANPRFVQDFKTLADVLIQETVKHDIGEKFADLRGNIFGEESNIFCNQLGEKICVQVLDSREKTSQLLEQVLNGDKEAANVLAEEVHKDIKLQDINTQFDEDLKIDLNIKNLGIWIDPIDSTAEYITGGINDDSNNISKASGLKCVTVLIGVFDLTTGKPLMGIINQPFSKHINNSWLGQCFWGVTINNLKINSINTSKIPKNIISISSSESESIKIQLKDAGFHLVEASGAGYKILTVIQGMADAYLLTKSSTFKWDTCAAQAILLSLNGDIVVYNDTIKENKRDGVTYKINASDNISGGKLDSCCNHGGIIAYKDVEVLEKIIGALKT